MFSKGNIDDYVLTMTSTEEFRLAKTIIFSNYRMLRGFAYDNNDPSLADLATMNSMDASDELKQKPILQINFTHAYEFMLRAGRGFYQESSFLQKLSESDVPTLKKKFGVLQDAFLKPDLSKIFAAYVELDKTIKHQPKQDKRYENLKENLIHSRNAFSHIIGPFVQALDLVKDYIDFYCDDHRQRVIGEFEELRKMNNLYHMGKLFQS